jgi:hypothetical protein
MTVDLGPAPVWASRAACASRADLPWTTDATVLMTTLPRARARRVVAAMARVCDGCPVRTECAAHAEAIEATGGWWAGTDRSATQLPLWTDIPETSSSAVTGASTLRRTA